jgi:hypothetical protein
VETDIASTQVDSDGTVTSVYLGLDGMINSSSHFFSLYTDCQSVLFKNRFCLSMEEDSVECTAASSVHGLEFSPACTKRSVPYVSAPCAEYRDGVLVQHYAELPPGVWVYYAKGVSTRLVKQTKGLDPPFECIGI